MRIILLLLLFFCLSLPPAVGQTEQLFAVEENGARSDRINIVFLSEGYTVVDMPKFAGHVRAVMNFLFAREPWHQYRSYCNVYRIEVASNESGCDNGDTSGPGGLRDTYFSTGFNSPAVGQLLQLTSQGSNRAYTLLNQHVPEFDVPIMLVNDDRYGGSGGPIAVASVNFSSAAIVEHELGHSFAGLADEYDIEYAGYSPAERFNTTAETDRNRIRWRHWIAEATPLPTPETAAFDDAVGLFEGSMYRTNGWYRPHNNSLMRNLNRPVGAVNREQFVLSFYERVGPLDARQPAADSLTITGFSPLAFDITPKRPAVGEAVEITWSIDGVVQAAATGTNFTVSSEFLGNGTHAVTALLRDPTPFVRLDPGGTLTESITWTLILSGQLPADLAAWRAAFGDDSTSLADDGVANLIKYALGLDPTKVAGADQLPALALMDGHLALRVSRRNRRADVDCVVEFSSDMLAWESGAARTLTVEDTETLLLVRELLPAPEVGQRFLRLSVRER